MLSALYNLVGLNHTLPCFEVPRTKCNPATRARVRPLRPARLATLNFTPIQLAHAIVKADCYTRDHFEWFMAFTFLIQHHRVFAWSSRELRLQNEARAMHFDFVNTTLIGRVGNGLSLLLAQQLGFDFEMHLAKYLSANGHATTRRTPTGMVALPIADFVCKGNAGRAIVESKGGFPPAHRNADIRADLIDGLGQIGTWPATIGAAKSYAVGSYLREIGDPHPEGSLVAFVDPDDDPLTTTLDITDQEIVKHNYAPWFVAMGLPAVAARLRGNRDIRARSHQFIVYEYDANPGERQRIAFPADSDDDDHQARLALGNAHTLHRFGIEEQCLRGVEQLMTDRLLPSIFSQKLLPKSFSQSDTQGGSSSLFSDGSFLGVIAGSQLQKEELIEVTL